MVDTAEFNLVPDNEEEEFVVDFGEVTNVGGGGGTSDFNRLTNRPKYDNQTMTGNTNIPKVPTKTSDLNNDSDYQTGTEVSSTINTAIGEIDIPSKTSELTNDGSDGTSTYVEADELATVATSGSYADLENKPTIPIVNDASLAITQNGETKGTFTANDADDVIIALTDTTNITILGDNDANYTKEGTDYIALWLLPSGKYTLAEDATVEMVPRLVDGDPADTITADMNPIVLITNEATTDTIADIVIFSSNLILHVNTEYNTGNAVEVSFLTTPFTGTDGSYDGKAGLVPAPTTSDVGKFLKSDGTWDTAGGGGPTVVQTTGTSTTDVMSQNATTSMVFADPSTAEKVQIGSSSSSSAYQSVAVGSASRVSSARGVAVGPQSYANASSSVAIGAGSVANIAGSVDVGCSRIGGIGYNSTDYRIITGVYDGQSIHDVATKGQLDSIAIQNAGAPTTSTVGTVGQLLQDTTNGKLYICTDATNPYVWEEVGAGGGGGPTVVQTTGTSQSDVMSQNAVTGLLFNSARKYRVQIGDSATTMSDYAISIGNSAYTNSIDQVSVGRNAGFGTSGQGTLCIGRDAKVTGDGGIALGAKSKATAKGEMNIGTTDSAYGYSSSNYRLLSGVYDGQSAHDAVTVNQVNATIDAINTALSTNIPHIGA